MPTLDDAPTLAPLSAANLSNATTVAGGGTASPTEAQLSKTDLVQIYDTSQRKVRTISVANLAVALGITLA